MEQNAVEAEREAVRVMQAEYMKRHLGDVFKGVISGVTNYGIYVEITDLLIEGMVHVREMGDDYYVYDEKRYALVGRRRKHEYRLGSPVMVQVVSVDVERHQVTLALAEE
jgi:ribonuclease R